MRFAFTYPRRSQGIYATILSHRYVQNLRPSDGVYRLTNIPVH